MKSTVYSPEDEQQLMVSLWAPFIADNPLAFVMYAFPWGQKGTPLEHFTGPRRWQRRILKRIAKHIDEGRAINIPKLLRMARASGRGIGKSALVAWLVLWFVSTRIGATAIVSANTEDQLRKITFSEIEKWASMSMNAHWWELTGITMTPAKWLKELVERDLQKGTGYWGVFGKLWSEEKPDSYAGVHNHDGVMVIFDEGSGIPDPIWAVAQGFFTEPTFNRFWFAFSQGRRNSGYFFEIFGKKRDQWESEQIDARDVEGTDPRIYQDILDEYGEDSDEARVEVYGLFPQDDDVSFISYSLVEKAMGREVVDDKDAPIVVGVDPSRSGSDYTVILVRQGRKILDIRRFRVDEAETGTMETVGHIVDVIREFNPVLVVIDEGLMGGPLVDRLKEQKFKQVRGVNFSWKAKKPTHWGNKRAEMWGEMKAWLVKGSIPDDKRLKTDLTGVRKKPDSKGVMFLESKKDMRARGLASPDSADALAVTFAFPVASKGDRMNTASKRVPMTNSPRYAGAASSTGWMGH